MNPQILKLVQELQVELSQIDDQTNSDRLEPIHDKLLDLADCLEAVIPALKRKRQRAEVKANLEEVTRLLKGLTSNLDLPEGTDSLEQIEKELGEEPDHPVGVPSKRNPSPKGLVGGVALPLPEG